MALQTLNQINRVELVGTLASPPVLRELRDGESVMQWRMKICVDGEPSTSVPCSSVVPSVIRRVSKLEPGAALVATGSVVSRFWVSAGATGSRVEVMVTAAEKCRLES